MSIFNDRVRPTVLAKVKDAPQCRVSLNKIPGYVMDGEHFYLDPADVERFEAHWCAGCYLNNANCLEQGALRDGSIASDLRLIEGKPACTAFDPPDPEFAGIEIPEDVIEAEAEVVPVWARVEVAAPQAPICFGGRLKKYYPRYGSREFMEVGGRSLGATLDGQLLAIRWAEEDRRREGLPQRYFDLAFVDEERRAACLSLRGDSANVVADKIALWSMGRAIPAMRMRLHFVGADFATIHLACSFVEVDEFEAAQAFLASDDWRLHAWVGV